jgi:hypothetical protein
LEISKDKEISNKSYSINQRHDIKKTVEHDHSKQYEIDEEKMKCSFSYNSNQTLSKPNLNVIKVNDFQIGNDLKMKNVDKKLIKIEPEVKTARRDNSKISTTLNKHFKSEHDISLSSAPKNYSISRSPSNREVDFVAFEKEKVEYHHLYSNRELTELKIFRGIPFKNFKTPSNTLEIFQKKINFIGFPRPSNPILNIDFKNFNKYTPVFCTQNVINKNKKKNEESEEKILTMNLKPNKKIPENNKITKKSYLKQAHGKSQTRGEEISKSIIYTEESEETPYNKYSGLRENDISPAIKNKIYFWLIDIDILKENSVKVDDIPYICANGVLLADLVNRLEGVYINLIFRE